MYPVSQYSAACSIASNFKKLEPIIVTFGTLYAEGPSF